MAKLSKRMRKILEECNYKKSNIASETFTLLKRLSSVKFNESIDVAVTLGVDPRKSDQAIRGASVLPNGTGKNVRVAVFTQGENIEKAKQAGADFAGMEELANAVRREEIKFDVAIATPDVMKFVAQLGQILGPKGLMPNPKVGTVATNVELAVKSAKTGQIRYRVDKAGIIHTAIGKIDFESEKLEQNLKTLLIDLKKLKPANAKGVYFKKIIVSSTMGPGLALDITSLEV